MSQEVLVIDPDKPVVSHTCTMHFQATTFTKGTYERAC